VYEVRQAGDDEGAPGVLDRVAVGGVKTYRTAMGAMAGRSADKAAAFLSQYFAGEGWIPQSKVKKSLL
jgi:hypothetical protein